MDIDSDIYRRYVRMTSMHADIVQAAEKFANEFFSADEHDELNAYMAIHNDEWVGWVCEKAREKCAAIYKHMNSEDTSKNSE